jgi:arachidonate 15-lipoxygenase
MIFINLPVPAAKGVLPQNDDAPQKRAAKLLKTQSLYTLTSSVQLPIDVENPDVTMDVDIPLLTKMPASEAFNDEYVVGRGVKTVPMVTNQAFITKITKNPFSPFGATPMAPFEPPFGLADYQSQFIQLETPAVVKNWMTDARFAEQRLSGANPGAIKKLTLRTIPSTLDTEQLESKLGSDIATLISTRQLYFVDHTEILKDVQNGELTIPLPQPIGDLPISKFLPKAIALFEWVNEGDVRQKAGKLVPVAIQVDTSDTAGSAIFVPEDDNWNGKDNFLWTIAKICFSITDANAHEMHTHLGIHHFAQEAFGAITPRQLATNHPLFLLLKPHLRFLVFNNKQGIEKLVQASGPVDILLAGNLESSMNIAINATKTWSLAHSFEDDLTSRGVNDKTELPHYPYRDDGKLIWQAIHDFVEEYLNLYYPGAADISGDVELQAWAAELASTSDSGGNINGMPTKIDTLTQLIDIATMIIFTNSAGHSAINFPQFPYMGFSPNMPLAAYADHRAFMGAKSRDVGQQMAFLQVFLPRQFTAALQIGITNALSAFHFDELGDYGDIFGDVQAKQAVYKFGQALQDIEQRIVARNRSRFVPYQYLQPTEILNSASI